MLPRPPRSTRTDTLFPYTTLVRALHRMFQHVRRMGQNRLVIARCAGNGGARADRRIASRKLAIVQEEDQWVPRIGAADQAKARHPAVSLFRPKERRVGNGCVSPCSYR